MEALRWGGVGQAGGVGREEREGAKGAHYIAGNVRRLREWPGMVGR